MKDEVTVFVGTIVSDAVKPAPRLSLSEWSESHRIIPPEVTASPGPWKNDKFPFLTEIMDCLCPWHPAETVTFMKSAQVGGTEVGINWLFAIADMWPGPCMMVHQSLTEAKKWVKLKLMPSLRATEQLRGKVKTQKSRDGESTTDMKAFNSGYWLVTGANSSGGISSQSVRYIVKEEWDRWPADVDGQGDPDQLVDARQISYHKSGKHKQLRASTPASAAISRIQPAYYEGDQRKYHVPCPECGHEQVLEFFPDKDNKGGLRFNTEPPYSAHYACVECGCLIPEAKKAWMLDPANGAKWIAEKPGTGRQPSFHISALYSPVTTWDKVAENFLRSKDDQQKFRAFYNLWLGLAWEEKGDAPEWERLMAVRQDYKLGTIPDGGLLITGAADVQKDGIFYEIVAWGRDKISWSIDFGFLEGATTDHKAGAWLMLNEVIARTYSNMYGNSLGIDLFGVDSGYNTHAVYAWVRGQHKARALDGRAGWQRPAIGTPTKQEVNIAGRKIKNGIRLWPVGTWPLKSEFYGNLRNEWLGGDDDEIPSGCCFFSKEHDEGFFKQLTAESLKDKTSRGRIVKEWVVNGQNHFHDCRIYNMGMAELLNISRFDDLDWLELEADRNAPAHIVQPELFTPSNEARSESFLSGDDEYE